MKKTLVAIAALASFGAYAQSSVTLFGIIDAGVESVSNQSGKTVTSLAGGGGELPTLFGMKGSEDLGGGLKANFILEGSYNSATGAGNGPNSNSGLFGREAKVGLSGAFGSVNLGLQIDPALISFLKTDPGGLGQTGSGLQGYLSAAISQANLGGTNGGVNSFANIFDSNAVSYSYSANGFSGTILYALGGGNGSANTVTSGGVSYENGPLLVSAGAFQDKGTGASTAGLSEYNVGAAYKAGAFTVKANYIDFKPKTVASADPEITDTGVGVDYMLSAANKINVSYYDLQSKTAGTAAAGSVQSFSFTFDHTLSKSTGLYFKAVSGKNSHFNGVAIVDQSGVANYNAGTSTGFVAGLHHAF